MSNKHEPHVFAAFKPRPDVVITLSIGFGAINVVANGIEAEFVPVENSGEPECQEVWDDLKGECDGGSDYRNQADGTRA